MDARRYLVDVLLPFWAERAFDAASGAFVSALDAHGRPVPDPARLCLVQARLAFCFSHAQRLGSGAWAARAADAAFGALHARLVRPDGLYARAFDADTGEADRLADFYDQAFVLFALAHRVGDPGSRPAAHALAGALDRHLADPAGGYREDTDGTLPRRQNPHMHLLEALLAWADATGEPLWRQRARAVVELFLARFYDRDTATLREDLAPDLSPLAGVPGRVREPGHHLEWVWLLLHYRRLTGDDRVTEPAARLFETAWAHGRNPSGLVIEAMTPQGEPLARATLLWPQTEAVKALLARHEFLDDAPRREADAMLAAMFRHHVPGGGPLWINRLDADGRALSSEVPTRVLYHLVMALGEVVRLERADHAAHAR